MKNSAGARLSVADLQSPQNGAQKVKQMPIIEAEFEATSPAGEFYVLKSNNLQYNTLGPWVIEMIVCKWEQGNYLFYLVKSKGGDQRSFNRRYSRIIV